MRKLGQLLYGAGNRHEYEIDDRPLAHLQQVIVAKLRRGETFTFNWVAPAQTGINRAVLWMHPALELQFVYAGSKFPELNRDWIDLMIQAANSAAGLRIMPEPNRSQPT